MTYFSRLFTSLTSLAIGIFFILLAAASLRATAVHGQSGDTTSGSITLGTAFLLFFAALLFALPTPRQKLIYATFSAPARAFLGTLFIAFFGIVAALLAASPNLEGNPFLLGLSQFAILAALGGLFFAFLITFLVPGIAYSELRAAYREAQTFVRSRTTSYSNALDMSEHVDHRGPFAKMLAGVFGLAFLGVVVLAGYGLSYAQFISSAAHEAFVKENIVWIILGFGFIVFGSLYFEKRGRSAIRNPVLRIAGFFVLFAPMAFLSIPAAQSGLPAVLSLQEDGRYESIEVTVVARGLASSRRGCDRKVKVVWEAHNRQLCNIPEQIWRDLKPGQILELQGFLTNYGFRYERVRRAS